MYRFRDHLQQSVFFYPYSYSSPVFKKRYRTCCCVGTLQICSSISRTNFQLPSSCRQFSIVNSLANSLSSLLRICSKKTTALLSFLHCIMRFANTFFAPCKPFTDWRIPCIASVRLYVSGFG